MNIILQHWAGEMSELGLLSSLNIADYAARMGAEYRLLRGHIFRKHLSPQSQKLYMLDAVFDDYDMVVMLDMDMFAVTGLTENVFTDITGTGLFSEFTATVFQSFKRMFPGDVDQRWAYWGGAIYRLPRELRQRLRAGIVEGDLDKYSSHFHDEGIMHRLAARAKIPQDRIPDKWCQCSYLPHPETAAMIHIRTKIAPEGPKRSKMENYLDLRARGIIE